MKKITTRSSQLRQSCLLLALITSGILMTIGYSSPIISGSEVNENTSPQALTLWYQEPAAEWEQALPLGNGRLGTMVYGGIQKEKLMLNEDSLWSGWPEPENDREGAHLALKKLRAAIKNGNIVSANKIALEEFCSLYGYGKPDFGAYQAFCDLEIDFNHDPKAVTNYRRELDLKTATATVSYTAKGIDYKREVFCSYPDQVTVMRITASKPASLDLKLSFTSLHQYVKVIGNNNGLTFSGEVDTQSNGEHKGVAFEASLQVLADGGSLKVTKSKKGENQNDFLAAQKCTSLTLIIAGSTNYELKYPDYKGASPELRNIKTLNGVNGKSFDLLKSTHLADYQKLFSRVELDLGGQNRSELPTNKRIKEYRKDTNDQGLEELLFQYGRYLLIASSRPGSMPANLQGLWNNSNTPPWNCDYHLNINFQMNYWPVDSCNLSECAEPMIRWTKDLSLPGAKSAKAHYDSPGWVAHHSCNTWGYTPPGPKRGIHMLEAESAAFLCQNIWDHYAFTQDKDYLERDAWPILKGAAEFWLANLQEIAGGYLAVSPSYSPEHGPLSDGAYYQTMIIWDLFTNCIEAAKVLGGNDEFAKKLLLARERLQPLKIGEFGQLQEWRDSKLEKNADKDKHRHVSHLYSVYPSKQIIPGRDIDLTAAARQSMAFRGDKATGWSMGWKINLWARFLDGDHAHKLIKNLISNNIYDNLWDSHPPFQIDGNFGYTAGVAEMLLQSHTNEIRLLPALPKVWSTGSVKGLRARGGYAIDLAWQDGQLTLVTIKAKKEGLVTVRYGDTKRKMALRENQVIHLDHALELKGI